MKTPSLNSVTAKRSARIAATYARLSSALAKSSAPSSYVSNARLSRADVASLLN